MMFEVQKRQCKTCIYRPESPLDLQKLEQQVADGHGGFRGHRICHHSDTACCRGFWDRHKDEFQMGQLSQRMGWVRFVNHDTTKERA
jgi:hypothetical protein